MKTLKHDEPEAMPPYHLRRDSGLCAEKISSRSVWGDAKWVFDNPTPGASNATSTITWSVELPDGTNLLDQCNAETLDWMRRLAWSLSADPGDGAMPLAPASASVLSTGLRAFACWMNGSEIRLPCEMSERVWNDYLADLPHILAGDDEEEPDISIGRALLRIRVPLLIWRQRLALSKGGVSPPPCPPWDGRSGFDVASEVATSAVGWTKPLPDEITLPLLNAAARLIGAPAQDVIRAYAAAERAVGPLGVDGFSEYDRSYQGDLRNEALAEFTFSTLPDEDGPWHDQLVATWNDKNEWIWPLQRLRQLTLAVQSAAVITLQASTGMRISEICGLPSGMEPSTGLPRCVRVEKSATALNEVFIVRTLLSKTEHGPREVDWLIGMRPMGSDELPISVIAILVLEDLLQPFRSLGGSDRLLVSLSNNRGLPRSSESVGLVRSSNLVNAMRNFIEEWVDLSRLPDQSAHPTCENDLVFYRETRGRCIRSHQFRKSYASFVLSVDTALLPALQAHFHHISQAMTEGGYWGRNPLQIEPLSTMQRQRTAETMYEMATGKSVSAGRMGDHLAGQIGVLRDEIAGNSIEEGWRTTLKFVNDYDLRLWFAPHGKCLPLVPEAMRCHDVAGTGSWLNREPNYAAREPGVCVGCPSFLMDARHIPFWERRYFDNQLAFLGAERRGAKDDFRVMRERAAQARALLRRVGVSTVQADRAIDDLLS